MRADVGRLFTELDPEQTRALTELLRIPESWDADPRVRVLNRAGRKVAGLADVDGVTAFVKAYRPRPGLAGLKEALRRSPGLSLWHIGQRVRAAGVPTPAPLLAGEVRRGRLLEVSFFACEALQDAVPMDTLVTRLRPEQRAPFVKRLAQCMAQARRRGFAQSDLKPSNLFIQGPADGEFQVIFVDLRRAAVGGLRGGWFRRKTRRYLRYRILAALGFGADEIDDFFRIYDA